MLIHWLSHPLTRRLLSHCSILMLTRQRIQWTEWIPLQRRMRIQHLHRQQTCCTF
jgi:hypothetical protein